jgi:hypothetical protein
MLETNEVSRIDTESFSELTPADPPNQAADKSSEAKNVVKLRWHQCFASGDSEWRQRARGPPSLTYYVQARLWHITSENV